MYNVYVNVVAGYQLTRGETLAGAEFTLLSLGVACLLGWQESGSLCGNRPCLSN